MKVPDFSRGMRKVEGLLSKVTGADSRPIRTAALVLVRAIKVELSTPGRGRIRRGKRKSRASIPGDPPAPDTGALRNSISSGTVGGVMRVGSGMAKAPALNNGTTTAGPNHNITIAPRPFMQPALNKARKDMGAAVVSDLRDAARNL